FDGNYLKMYVNGALVGMQRVIGNIVATNDPLRIGGDWSREMFTGLIDNVRIYNVALSPAAIQADMTTPVTAIGTLTATFSNGGAVNEGSTGTVSFSNASGGSGGYTYSYDFNNDGVFEVTNSASATAIVPASYLADGPGSRVVHGRITD